MSDHSDIHSSSFPYESEQKKTRGQRLVFWLLVAGLSMIFLTLLAGVVYHWISNEFSSITVPFIFYGSTLILAVCSYLMEQTWRTFESEQWSGVKIRAWSALGLAIVFIAAQALGWYVMFKHLDIGMKQTSGAFLYLLSGVHLIHVLLVIPFQSAFTINLQSTDNEDEDESMRQRNQRLRMELLRNYWHFLGIVWGILFIVLLLMQFFGSIR